LLEHMETVYDSQGSNPALTFGWKETNLPNMGMDFCFFAPDGTTQTDVLTENTDVREVGFHPPVTSPQCL
jgi:hypothetical protein